MFGFDVVGDTPEEFAQKIAAKMAKRDLGSITQFSVSEDVLTVTFSRVGKSHIRFKLFFSTDGFKARFLSDEISATHRSFRGEVKSKFRKILEEMGAVVYG